jgi:hypothetical protein
MEQTEPKIVKVPYGTLAMTVPVINKKGIVIGVEHVKIREVRAGMPWAGKSERLGVIFIQEQPSKF